jgi:hypothetical protein
MIYSISDNLAREIEEVVLVELAACNDDDVLRWLVTSIRVHSFNLLDNVHTFKNLSKNDMTSIEPSVCRERSEIRQEKKKKESKPRVTHEVTTVVMKNWLPLVLGPALAIESNPGRSCLRLKFCE